MRAALLLCRVFRALTRLLPRSYSPEQRADAIALTARLAREAHLRGGTLAAARVAAAALADLLAQIVRARTRLDPVRDLLGGLARDLHHGFRAMGARPGYSAMVIGVLALGIGLNAAVFSVVDWVLLRPLPYPSPQALVRVWAGDKAALGTSGDLAYSEVDAFRAASSFRAAAGVSMVARVARAARLEPIHVNVARVTGDVFSTLATYPVLGRPFDARDTKPVVVLSHAFWRNRLGSELGVVGDVIALDNEPHTIVGVMPAGRGYPLGAELWRPATVAEREDDDRENVMIARLADGVDQATAMSELSALRPATRQPSSERIVWTEDLHASDVRGVRAALIWVAAAAALVLVVACANVAALIGTRGLDRAGELAIRGALGGSRLQLGRQLLVEGLVLATAGGALGIIIGAIALDALVTVAPPALPRLHEIALDARVIAAGVVVMLVAGIAVSLLPAWRAARTDLVMTLNAAASARSSVAFGSPRFLVAGQVAAAVVLTIAAVLLTRSLRHLVAVDHGFDPSSVAAVSLNLRGMDAGEAGPLFHRVIQASQSVPGIRAAAVAFRPPTEVTGLRVPVRMEASERSSAVALRVVTPAYFETVGIPIVDGRGLTAADSRDRPRVGLVNHAFVRELAAGASPIDRRLVGELIEAGVTVVGVVGDVTPAGQSDRPALYLSYDQFPINAGTLLVKTAGHPSTLLPALRDRIRAVAPALPLDRIQTLDEALAAGRSVDRFNTLLASSFGVLTLMLSMIGVYGLTSREVASRRRESGVRAALGADRLTIVRELTRPVGIVTIAGIIAGAGAAAAATQSMRVLLHGVTPVDPMTFLAVPASIAVIAATSVLAAAWPILRMDPAKALRI